MEVKKGLQVYSLQRCTRVWTISILRRHSTLNSSTASLLQLSFARTSSVWSAAEASNKPAAFSQSNAVTRPSSSAATPLSDAIDAAPPAWRYVTESGTEPGDDMNGEHGQTRPDVVQQLLSGSFQTSDLPAHETGHTQCGRGISEMNLQERQDSEPCAENENNTLACSDSGATILMSGTAAEWPDTSAYEPSRPGGRPTAFSTETNVNAPIRSYFPLCFGSTSSPFSYTEKSGAPPNQAFYGGDPPPRTSFQRDSTSENVFLKPARDETCAHISVIPPDSAQSSSQEYQSFFVTLPVRHGVCMSTYAPTAAAIAAARTREESGVAADITATEAAAPTPEVRDETPTPKLPVPTGATDGNPVHGHSTPGPHIKYRVHCGQVWAIGPRQHFIVETEPVESSPHRSHVPDPSLMTESGYTYGRLDICPEELEREFMRYKRRRRRRADVKQSQRRRLVEGLKPKEALSRVSTPCGPASDLDGDDTRSLSTDEEEPGTTAYIPHYLRANEELRRLHESLHTRAPVPEPAACEKGRESVSRDAAEIVAPQAGRFPVQGACISPTVDRLKSPTQSHSVLAGVHPLPTAAFKSLDVIPVTADPSRSPYPDVFHENSATFGVPASVVDKCSGANDSAFLTTLNTCAVQMAGQTSVPSQDDTAPFLRVREDPLNHIVDTCNNVDESPAKGRGLRGRRPPPLDPELVIQGPDVMAVVFVPSPFTVSPSSTMPLSASDSAPPTTGPHHYNNLDSPFTSSEEVHTTEKWKHQERLNECIPSPSTSPIATPMSFPATPPNALAYASYDELKAECEFLRLCEAFRDDCFPRGSILYGEVSHEGFSGCSRAYCPTNGVGNKQKRDRKNEQTNHRMQEGSPRIQGPYDTDVLLARGVTYDQTQDASKRSAAEDVYVERPTLAKNVRKHAGVRGLAPVDQVGVQSDTFSNRHTATSTLPRKLRASVDVINELEDEIRSIEDLWRSECLRSSVTQETETRTSEDVCKSQRSLLPVVHKIETSTATSVTETHAALFDTQADDRTDEGVNTQHDGPSEDFQEPAFLFSSSNCSKGNVCTDCGLPQREEPRCRIAASNRLDGQKGKHVKRPKRRTSAAAQAPPVLATNSTVLFDDNISEFWSGDVAESNENGDRETTTTMPRQCTLAARTLVRGGDTNRSEALGSEVCEGTERVQERQGTMALQGPSYSLPRPSSTSSQFSAAVSSGSDWTYTDASGEDFTDAEATRTPDVPQEGSVPSGLMLHNFCELANREQNVKVYSPTCFSPHHCRLSAFPLLEKMPEATTNREDKILAPSILPVRLSVPGSSSPLTSEPYRDILSESCKVEIKAQDTAVDGKRRIRVGILLSSSAEKRKASTVANGCNATSLLKQYCARTVHSIKKKRAQEQEERRQNLLNSSVLPPEKCGTPTSVTGNVTPPVCSVDPQLNPRAKLSPLYQVPGTGTCTQSDASEEMAIVDRVLQDTLEARTYPGVLFPGVFVARRLQNTRQRVHTQSERRADVRSASMWSRASSSPHRRYETDARGRSPGTRPRWSGQFPEDSPVPAFTPVVIPEDLPLGSVAYSPAAACETSVDAQLPDAQATSGALSTSAPTVAASTLWQQDTASNVGRLEGLSPGGLAPPARENQMLEADVVRDASSATDLFSRLFPVAPLGAPMRARAEDRENLIHRTLETAKKQRKRVVSVRRWRALVGCFLPETGLVSGQGLS